MSLPKHLAKRCNKQCELCAQAQELSAYSVPESEARGDCDIALCSACLEQINSGEFDIPHWRSLSDTMWNPTPVVQVMAWRMLKRLESENWAQDALEMLYLDDDTREWAEAGVEDDDREPTLDANGAKLTAGDNVVVIKDLDVKGANFVAKRGTAVRGISLTDNPEHIEGRVNGTRIVLLTKYIKKS